MKEIILIADANNDDGEALRNVFAKEGYQVEVVKSGPEVIKKVQDTKVGVLIMDVELQGMKGYEVAPIVKEFEPDLLVIMTSGDSSIGIARRVRREEIFFYCIKPIDLEEMKLVVKEAFKKIRRMSYGPNKEN